MGKLLGLVALVVLALIFFAPRTLPRALRALGRFLRTAGRAGQEIATGEDLEDGPLAQLEVRAGDLVAGRIESSHRSASPDAQERIARIGARIAKGARRSHLPFRFLVLEEETPNAWAVPGGRIYITSSLVELCGTGDDALAGVLGHEIAHVDLRHALRKLAARTAAHVGTSVLFRSRLGVVRRVAGELEELTVCGYDRENELQADLHGATLAGRAGYDPAALADLLAELEKLSPEGCGPLAAAESYFRSHPPLALRRQELERRFGSGRS